ncbi:molecular chaperone DnaJ [Candidatus Falkowbacteria bacterium RBG_13_39_14]|uniref:Chaperone protein DnaJ n=1 Tax=Candidatus Falkowbacteria bacterium RBG_13_39_14 TaxID=1797985 RepID=A0A1F5S171_9BACT|nr:MAG: molecular chaperone DnaJ [Candidatus Falkowbacteria bacterium RBG_13_39_14]
MGKDYYKILGVSKDASKEDIKRAFRRLAHQYHPDKDRGDEKKFKEANEAYQVLSDDKKRSQYDQFGSSFEQAQSGGGFSGFGGFRDFSGFANGFNINMEDLGDIFEGAFGFGGEKKQTAYGPWRGEDMEVMMEIDFKEAVFGDEKEIELEKDIICDRCSGNGAEPGTRISKCPTCMGTGQVKHAQRTIFGTFQTVTTCPECRGAGKRAEKMCSRCGGSGIVHGTRRIKVKIPAGIDNNEVIKLSGQGDAGREGGPAGDLYIKIRVKPSHKFRREGYDIYTKEYISFKQAALGDKISVQTIDEGVKLKIPEGTQTGTIFKLKGKGVHKLRSFGRGDHFIEVVVRTPENLTRAQKQALEELD